MIFAHFKAYLLDMHEAASETLQKMEWEVKFILPLKDFEIHTYTFHMYFLTNFWRSWNYVLIIMIHIGNLAVHKMEKTHISMEEDRFWTVAAVKQIMASVELEVQVGKGQVRSQEVCILTRKLGELWLY